MLSERLNIISLENPKTRVALLSGYALTLPLTTGLSNLMLIVLSASWLAEPDFKSRLQKLKQTPVLFLFMALPFVYAFGMLYTESVKDGVALLTRSLGLTVFPLIIGTLKNPLSQKEVRSIFTVFVCVTLLISVSGIVVPIETVDTVFTTTRNYRALYLILAFAFVLYYGFFTKALSVPTRIGIVTLAILLMFLLIDTASKIHIFLCPLIIILFSFSLLRRVQNVALAIAFFLAISALWAVFIVNNDFTSDRIKRFFVTTDYIRRRNWKTNIEVIKENLMFGVGTGDGLAELQDHREKFWMEYEQEYNSHNQYLEILLRTGLIGLLIFAAMLLVPLSASIKTKDYLYLAFILIFMVACLTESLLIRQKGIAFYSFFNIVFWSRMASRHLMRTETQKMVK